MALEKAIEGATGATALYWRVIEVNLNYFANVGAGLAGYVSKATRDAGKRPLDSRQFPIQGADFESFSVAALDVKNPVAAAYDYVKDYDPNKSVQPGQQAVAVNPFFGAKDV